VKGKYWREDMIKHAKNLGTGQRAATIRPKDGGLEGEGWPSDRGRGNGGNPITLVVTESSSERNKTLNQEKNQPPIEGGKQERPEVGDTTLSIPRGTSLQNPFGNPLTQKRS